MEQTSGSTGTVGASDRIRAARYVRMSTDHQKYSTENQGDAVQAYAKRRGFEVVRTYEDSGKSGLSIDGRRDLKQLISDVQTGQADFRAILVYDVSRWGRFQDADESAYYEFICKEAGIAVHYCAEQFENDGSLSSTIIKNMKRAMAGEYSRELSAKVFAGQCRLIGLGFRQGGMAGYGLRRQLVDEQRQPKAELLRGTRKSLQTDRVVLVPGPTEEIDTVRRVYRLFLEDGRTEREIATALNADGITTDLDRAWTRGTVHQLLTNEKYIGNNVYNRVSFKLKRKRVVNPPTMYIRGEGAFPSVVNPTLFEAVRHIIHERNRRFSDQQMLDHLSTLLKARGWLSGVVIDEYDGMPSSSAYRTRFGSLLKAYRLVGYWPARDYEFIEVNRLLRVMHADVVKDTRATIEALGATVVVDPETDLLSINGEFTASMVICRATRTSTGALRWKIRLDTGLQPDITVAVRLDAANQNVVDYYLLPRIDMSAGKFCLREDNGLTLDMYRFETLDLFFHLAARSLVRSAA